MVFAANGAFVVDGSVYGARFKHAQRAAEAAAHRAFYEAPGWRFIAPNETNEGEGDFAYLPEAHGGLILAGHGFRTELAGARRGAGGAGPAGGLAAADRPALLPPGRGAGRHRRREHRLLSRARSPRPASGCSPSSSRTR